jgi:putative addiction module component (TIGR02574 family)
MNFRFRALPLEERIRLVADLWDSIAAAEDSLPLTEEQRAELGRRLDAYGTDGGQGRLAAGVLADIRRKL